MEPLLLGIFLLVLLCFEKNKGNYYSFQGMERTRWLRWPWETMIQYSSAFGTPQPAKHTHTHFPNSLCSTISFPRHESLGHDFTGLERLLNLGGLGNNPLHRSVKLSMVWYREGFGAPQKIKVLTWVVAIVLISKPQTA